MSADDLSLVPENFTGQVRLFPLPNLVVFPHVMQPLHIFEPRYRAMLEEALAGDGLIGMALLAPGWETDYDGRPPLRPVGCLCRVATHHKTSEGSYNVLVLGLKRIVISRELPKIPEAQDQFDQLLGSKISLGMLTDIVAYTLDLDLDFKERLLSETCVDDRATELLKHLSRLRRLTFPPEFSLN